VLEFRESVAGFEETHRFVTPSCAVSGPSRERGQSTGMTRGSTDVASQSWQDGEPPPSDEVRGQMGSITPTHEASRFPSQDVAMAPIESRRSGQLTANALIGGCRNSRKGRVGLARACGGFARFWRTWRPSESTNVRQGASEVKVSGEALPVEGRGGSCGEQQVAVANSDEICEGLHPRSAPKSPRLKTAVHHRKLRARTTQPWQVSR
jgi:hypothetical protein